MCKQLYVSKQVRRHVVLLGITNRLTRARACSHRSLQRPITRREQLSAILRSVSAPDSLSEWMDKESLEDVEGGALLCRKRRMWNTSLSTSYSHLSMVRPLCVRVRTAYRGIANKDTNWRAGTMHKSDETPREDHVQRLLAKS